jgi:hypothetical protein
MSVLLRKSIVSIKNNDRLYKLSLKIRKKEITFCMTLLVSKIQISIKNLQCLEMPHFFFIFFLTSDCLEVSIRFR